VSKSVGLCASRINPSPVLTEYWGLGLDHFGYHVVTMTTPEYRGQDDRLAATLSTIRRDGAPIPLARYSAQSSGQWAANCALKPLVILRSVERHGLPCLWLDADSEVADTPRARAVIASLAESRNLGGCAVAAFTPAIHPGARKRFPLINSDLCSGTVWFGDTALAKSILVQWATRCAADPTGLDQDHLWDVSKGVITSFDPGLCCIPDLMPGVEPLIIHRQASRTMRDRIGG
jgi:hypothetical protein